jgi:hypothetical protein
MESIHWSWDNAAVPHLKSNMTKKRKKVKGTEIIFLLLNAQTGRKPAKRTFGTGANAYERLLTGMSGFWKWLTG